MRLWFNALDGGLGGKLVAFGDGLAEVSVGRRLWFSRVKGASTCVQNFRCSMIAAFSCKNVLRYFGKVQRKSNVCIILLIG